MRAWARWVAAALLVALAFAGGPDALDTGSPAAHAQVATSEGEKRDLQVRDDALASPHQIVDRGTPGHLRLVALPPSPQTAIPVPVRGALQAEPPVAPAAVTDVSGPPRLGACTPEALQIFRC
jgi:hypothetical protein